MGATPELYDQGEEQWARRVHAGCGGVYLDGYENVDVDGALAADCPAQRAANLSVIQDYYARLEGDWRALPAARPTVVDRRADLRALGYGSASLDKLVMIQAFEHLTPYWAWDCLGQWHAMLRPGGVLILSVPDLPTTLEWIEQEARRAFALRHLRGSLRTPHCRHWAWYTPETLAELLAMRGFCVDSLNNFHAYPAIVLRGVRRG